MYATLSTITDEKANTNNGLSVVKMRDVEYKLYINDSIWKAGPLKFAQATAWSKDGMVRHTTKRGLHGTHNTTSPKKISPSKTLQISPSVAPYPAELRELFRMRDEENPRLALAQQIIQHLVASEFPGA